MISGMFTDSLLIPKDLESRSTKGSAIAFLNAKATARATRATRGFKWNNHWDTGFFQWIISGKKETMVFIPEAQGVVFFSALPCRYWHWFELLLSWQDRRGCQALCYGHRLFVLWSCPIQWVLAWNVQTRLWTFVWMLLVQRGYDEESCR